MWEKVCFFFRGFFSRWEGINATPNLNNNERIDFAHPTFGEKGKEALEFGLVVCQTANAS